MFVSDCFEGSISDKQITRKSGFLDKILPGDVVLADRGFTIHDLLAEKGATLEIPPFREGRKQFTKKKRQLEVNYYPGPASMWSGLMRR